jgi:hypothetical protein
LAYNPDEMEPMSPSRADSDYGPQLSIMLKKRRSQTSASTTSMPSSPDARATEVPTTEEADAAAYCALYAEAQCLGTAARCLARDLALKVGDLTLSGEAAAQCSVHDENIVYAASYARVFESKFNNERMSPLATLKNWAWLQENIEYETELLVKATPTPRFISSLLLRLQPIELTAANHDANTLNDEHRNQYQIIEDDDPNMPDLEPHHPFLDWDPFVDWDL